MVILLHLNQCSGMHERGKTTVAPTSNAARQGDVRGTLLPTRQCRVQLFFWFHNSHQQGADSGRFALNWADSCRLVPYRSVSAATTNTGAEPADSGRNSKKKKTKKQNKTEENRRCEKHRLAKINKKGANAPFGQKPYISVHSYLYLNSHLQLSLTLRSLCSTPWLSNLCSPSPLSHTISLLRVLTLNSLTL